MLMWTVRWMAKFAIVSLTLYALYFIFTAISMITTSCESTSTENEDAQIPEIQPAQPFVEGQPKIAVLLSYQRSGSSFVGEWFNKNPDVFFSFEPVDSLYAAMYGTNQNMNVPSDITNYPNGTARVLPVEEIQAVSTFLGQYLTCDLDSMPIQSLLNYYTMLTYEHKSTLLYTRCIKTHIGLSFRKCENILPLTCGARFGEVWEERQRECLRGLWFNQSDGLARDLVVNLTAYKKCTASLKPVLAYRCQNHLLQSCQNRSTRVIKTVRATMDSMESLLEAFPNFRVIHLIRDPRAVALSRKRFPGYVLGLYSGNDSDTITKEAKLFCSTVLRDIKTRLALERKYPGRIYSMVFETVVTNPDFYLHDVYNFLGSTPHESTIQWLATKGKTNSDTTRTSNQIASEWENVLTFRMNKEITENCKELYDMVKVWTV